MSAWRLGILKAVTERRCIIKSMCLTYAFKLQTYHMSVFLLKGAVYLTGLSAPRVKKSSTMTEYISTQCLEAKERIIERLTSSPMAQITLSLMWRYLEAWTQNKWLCCQHVNHRHGLYRLYPTPLSHMHMNHRDITVTWITVQNNYIRSNHSN